MQLELKVPEISKDNHATLTISCWYKKTGDSFAADEPLAELLFDKAAFDFTAPEAGKLIEIKVGENDNCRIGDVIAIAEVSD